MPADKTGEARGHSARGAGEARPRQKRAGLQAQRGMGAKAMTIWRQPGGRQQHRTARDRDRQGKQSTGNRRALNDRAAGVNQGRDSLHENQCICRGMRRPVKSGRGGSGRMVGQHVVVRALSLRIPRDPLRSKSASPQPSPGNAGRGGSVQRWSCTALTGGFLGSMTSISRKYLERGRRRDGRARVDPRIRRLYDFDLGFRFGRAAAAESK